jgi:hypothetical protein
VLFDPLPLVRLLDPMLLLERLFEPLEWLFERLRAPEAAALRDLVRPDVLLPDALLREELLPDALLLEELLRDALLLPEEVERPEDELADFLERLCEALPPMRPPLRDGSLFSSLPRPEPARLPPPPVLLTVAQARLSASFAPTPRFS